MKKISKLLYKLPTWVRWPLTVASAFIGVVLLFNTNSYHADKTNTNGLYTFWGIVLCVIAIIFIAVAAIESNEQSDRRR